jgi:peptidoglycan/LPS O-acetylase OafA/YrhL
VLPKSFIVALLLVGAVTVAVAALTYLLVEMPTLSLKRFWALGRA